MRRLLAAALLVAGCARGPADRLPEGTLFAGDAAAARRFLAQVETLHDTPAALAARDLGRRLAGCRRFLAHCPPGKACTLAGAVQCEPTGELAAAADRERGAAAWLLVHRDATRRLAAWGEPGADGSLHVRARLSDDADGADAQPWEALLPARSAPDRPVLGARGALVALRLRSDRGAAPLRAMATGNLGDQLYSLKSDLFLGMTLEGTSEAMLYEPAPGELIPPLVLALHVKSRERGAQAMEEVLRQVRERWPVSRVPWSLGTAHGACLADLNVLPGLAPCYVATERAVVVGWNQRSVELALAAQPPGDDAKTEAQDSVLTLHLDRFPAADAALRRAYRPGGEESTTVYPWSRAVVHGHKEWGGYALELDLAAPATPAAAGGAS